MPSKLPSRKAKSAADKGSAAPKFARPLAAGQSRAPADSGEPAQSAEISRIRSLARAMSEGDLAELEIEDTNSGLRVRLRRGGEPAPGAAPQHAPSHAPAAPAAAVHAPAPSAAPAAAPRPAADTVPFTSPMVGTFYRSASPEAEAFVDVGSRVGDDSTLCIIEAMKVMNEIKAEIRGTIVEVLVQNGEPVEFGQPLFLIRPG
jgi:oxaloacetate decarboxylase alpha subunit